jgi:hypothetical protein
MLRRPPPLISRLPPSAARQASGADCFIAVARMPLSAGLVLRFRQTANTSRKSGGDFAPLAVVLHPWAAGAGPIGAIAANRRSPVRFVTPKARV